MTPLKKKKLETQPVTITSKSTHVITVRYPEIVNSNPKDSNNKALNVSLTDATGITNQINAINLPLNQAHPPLHVLILYDPTEAQAGVN